MGTLCVVATPIGNLEDVTLRALRVLGEAELVLAEDTRRTRTLLQHHGVSARPVSLHAHNEAARTDEVLRVLEGGGTVALVSDAGTPLVSDPGERLVEAAVAKGHEVVALPGASSVLAALSVAGLPADAFTFVGFLPRRGVARRERIEALRERSETLLLFESPRRLADTLAELAEAFGERRACVARELTKIHEEAVRGTLPELAERFAEGARGEVTLVVEGLAERPAELDDAALDAAIRAGLSAGRHAKELAAELAPRARRPRREIYARVLAVRDEDGS